ncbi:ABC transporter ATP-binding protein [Terriglobus sp. TAA 43]|uniref:ABC transporter ATP-binding protein n=1 Tax=Terriglobus sp. TAA 43 TaxID=278961 RepID=UPI00064874F9|nr:ABC transporter ATP-binding protein [Terriglobus sp. TAA 43]
MPVAVETVASLTNITKRYKNGVTALDGLSLDLHRGEIIALLGPNGAGKSTAVKLMMGLIAPTSGTVGIFGADPRDPHTRLRTGVMLQVGRAPEMLRVREHVNIFRGYYPHPVPYADLVKAAGLEGIEDRFFGQLSGGQKQRVLFAIALAGDPDLVFLDEPTVGLDIESRRTMWAEIRALAARGKTVLLTTHYLEEADALAHRIIVINKGKVICEGTPAEVKSMGSGNRSATAKSIKIIRCATTLTADHLQAMPSVVAVVSVGALIEITSEQPESTLREMLALDQSLGALEVESPALEDAFLALTSQN